MASHLTLTDWDRIAQLKSQQCSNKEIAVALGRAPSTISRELRRNASGDQYFAGTAQRLTQTRRSHRQFQRKCERPPVDKTIRRLLACRGSPEEIAARMQHERPGRAEDCVCASTIYRWIEGQGEQRAHWRAFCVVAASGRTKHERSRRMRRRRPTSTSGQQ